MNPKYKYGDVVYDTVRKTHAAISGVYINPPEDDFISYTLTDIKLSIYRCENQDVLIPATGIFSFNFDESEIYYYINNYVELPKVPQRLLIVSAITNRYDLDILNKIIKERQRYIYDSPSENYLLNFIKNKHYFESKT